jgi:hypothetical protein
MTSEAIAQSAAPGFQRKSDQCIITVDLEQRHFNDGLMTTHYNVWVGSLWDSDLTYGESEQMAFESGDSATIRERDALIRSLKYQARAMGYKRCEVRHHTLASYTATKALRATHQRERPTPRRNRPMPLPGILERMV